MEALKLYEKELGPENSKVAFVLNNLAYLYERQGNYDRALHHYLRALKI